MHNEQQYEVPRAAFELRFHAANQTQSQEFKEISLLGTQMSGIELKADGFLTGETSLETLETINPDGFTEISRR